MNKRKTNPLFIVVAAVLFLFFIGAIFNSLGRKTNPTAPASPATAPR